METPRKVICVCKFARLNQRISCAKKESVAILTFPYAGNEDAAGRILRSFLAYYPPVRLQQHKDAVEASGKALLTIYSRNGFPSHESYLGYLSEQHRSH